MKQKLSVVLAAIVGAFAIYCGEAAVNGVNGPGSPFADSGGFVKDGHADEPGAAGCCSPSPWTFTKLADGEFSPGHGTSEPIAVGNFREVIYYLQVPNNGSCESASILPLFRPDAETPFGFTRTLSFGALGGGRIPVDGVDMQLRLNGTCTAPLKFVVAGVR